MFEAINKHFQHLSQYLPEHFRENLGESVAEGTHDSRRKAKSEEDRRNCLFQRYSAENCDQRACPRASTGEWDTYKEQQEEKLALSHSFALVHGFAFEEEDELCEQGDFVFLEEIEDFVDKQQNEWDRDDISDHADPNRLDEIKVEDTRRNDAAAKLDDGENGHDHGDQPFGDAVFSQPVGESSGEFAHF